MLPYPESPEPFRLVAIDPGVDNMGVSLFEDHMDGRNVYLLNDCYTFSPKVNASGYRGITDFHDGRISRLFQIADHLRNLLHTYQPHGFIIEGNYYGRFADAFAALTECVLIARTVLFEYDPFMPLSVVDPTTAKKSVGMQRIKGTNKDDVKDALKLIKDITWLVDIDSLDQHSIDSVAIGYHYLKHIKDTLTC